MQRDRNFTPKKREFSGMKLPYERNTFASFSKISDEKIITGSLDLPAGGLRGLLPPVNTNSGNSGNSGLDPIISANISFR